MSSLKAKSKEKSAMRAVTEQPKASSKPSVAHVNGGNGIAANAYNPISGRFHSLDAAPSTGMPTHQINGRFRTMDEIEEHSGSSLSTTAEYDSVSNNGSCSGESEDQQKEKNTTSNAARTEPIPGFDIDKREKIKIKNEKKHQRQRERRAQELHERCCSYLTSRKLESLAKNLVAMGFTSEMATMALIHNEGRVDDSALWIIDGGEERGRQAASCPDVANPKIDIADQLARISELELSCKCTKQEVERVVVACEGDLDKAEETLKAQKLESSVATPKSAGSDLPSVIANGYHNGSSATSGPNSVVRSQEQGLPPSSVQLPRRDGRTMIPGAAEIEAASRTLQPALRNVQPNLGWMNPQVSVPHSEKRWTNKNPASPYFPSSSLQVASAQSNLEARFVATGVNEVNSNLLQGTLRDPIFMMQRPSSGGSRQSVPPSGVGLGASPPASTGWYHPPGTNSGSAVDIMKLANGGLGQQLRDLALSGSNSQQSYLQDYHHHQQQFISSSVDTGGSGWGGPYHMPGLDTGAVTRSSSPSLPVPSGLFTRWGSSGSSGSSSLVDWSSGGGPRTPHRDYNSIDWSVDSTPLSLPSSCIKGERLYDNLWHSSSYTPAKAGSRAVGNGDGSGLMVDYHAAPGTGSQEWTSSFAEMDLFRAPRRFVTSPSP